MRRNILFVLLSVIVCSAVHADHTVRFEYDAAGNRTLRAIVLPAASQARRGSTEFSDSTTAVFTDTFASLTLNVYPNPTRGHLKIELQGLSEGESYGYVIASTSGEIIVQDRKAVNPSEADLSTCASGLYVLKLTYKEFTKDFKIIKL